MNPAFASVDCAVSLSMPTTLGTETVSEPVEMVMVMVAPLVAVPVGDWLMTRPFSTLSLDAVCTSTSKPAAWSALVASDCDWPVTFGTSTLWGPLDS